MVVMYKGGEIGRKGGKQAMINSCYIEFCKENELENCMQIPNNKCPDDAAQSRIWNSCENVRQNVSCQIASTYNEYQIQCQFCRLYAGFYFPKRKFFVDNSGHYNFVDKGGKNFYSSPQFAVSIDANLSKMKGENDLAELLENRDDFRYDFDHNNLRSLQEFPNQQRFTDRLSLSKEGIPDKILNKLDNFFNVPTLKLSVPKFVFRSVTNLVDRVYKGFKNTQELRDITFYQFSQFIKSFIAICNITYSNRFLTYCIEHDIIPPNSIKRLIFHHL